MKKVLATLFVALCLNVYASTKSKDAFAQPPSYSNVMQGVTAQSPELAEASRLSADVVKLFAEKKYDEATPLAQHALKLREKALGRDHDLVGEALYNLANLYLVKKRYDESEPLFRRLLPIYEKRYGKDDLKLCPVLDNYSTALLFRGKLKESEDQLERSLHIRENAPGSTNMEVARITFRLGEFYRVTGRYGEAAMSYGTVVNIRRSAFGLDDLKLVDTDDTSPVLQCLDLMKIRQRDALEILSRPDVPQTKRSSDKADAQKTDDAAEKHVEGGVLNGIAISKPAPPYPPEAKMKGISGTVTVVITLDETGKVIRARAICGDPYLVKAAVDASRKARFTPTLLSGVPVKVQGTITYNFSLQ